MPSARVLVVDDDVKVLDRVRAHLKKEGYAVETASDGPGALKATRSSPPDLVVLDVNLPGTGPEAEDLSDGIEVLRRLREETDIPVIMLSTTSVGAVKVMALSLGADDYMTKPFDVVELTARIHAILRRARHDAPGDKLMVFRRLRLDPESRQVWKDGQPVELTTIEFELLHTLARRPGRAFTRDQLIEQAWKYSYYGVSKVVDVHVGHIRRKIEDDPLRPTLIATVRGIGYRFEDAPMQALPTVP